MIVSKYIQLHKDLMHQYLRIYNPHAPEIDKDKVKSINRELWNLHSDFEQEYQLKIIEFSDSTDKLKMYLTILFVNGFKRLYYTIDKNANHLRLKEVLNKNDKAYLDYRQELSLICQNILDYLKLNINLEITGINKNKYNLNGQYFGNFELENTSSQKIELSKKIKKHFGFFLKNCPRKHKQILNEDDYNNLINWTILYFQNNFKVPKITTPIKVVNTNKTYVQLAFKYLFKELNSRTPYPDTLFEFYKIAFSCYSDDSKGNFESVRNNDEVKKLMNIEY